MTFDFEKVTPEIVEVGLSFWDILISDEDLLPFKIHLRYPSKMAKLHSFDAHTGLGRISI